MRHFIVMLLGACVLGGCASAPQQANGVWINQAAIDAASDSGNLREALLAYGPNLEWQLDEQRKRAHFSNGFELGEGQLSALGNQRYRVDFSEDFHEFLSLDDAELVQTASDSWPEQRFVRPLAPPTADAPAGSSFEQALYRAYMGGTWRIEQGLGEGGLVLFHPDGRLEGMPGAERYALCLAGDCASMSGEHDSLWLQLGEQGQTWLFERDGERLRIFDTLNRARIDEVPDYHKGQQRWLLERQLTD